MLGEHEYIVRAQEILNIPRENNIFGNRYYDAVDRLFSHEDAIQAWHKLYCVEPIMQPPTGNESDEDKKSRLWWNKLSKSEIFEYKVDAMQSILRYSLISDSKKNTSSEIKHAAKEAQKMAKELVYLINRHSTLLDISLGQCLSEVELHAVEKSSDYFCNTYIQDKSSFPGINSFHYRSLRYQLLSQDLRDVLWRFAHFASETKDIAPIKPNPNSKDIEARVFCEHLCASFQSTYAKPLTHIVASFASAAFSSDYSNDTVKSWWNRLNKSS